MEVAEGGAVEGEEAAGVDVVVDVGVAVPRKTRNESVSMFSFTMCCVLCCILFSLQLSFSLQSIL